MTTTRLSSPGASVRQPVTSRKKLAKELAAFDPNNDLIELSALLERYDDAESADIRRLVDWSRAA